MMHFHVYSYFVFNILKYNFFNVRSRNILNNKLFITASMQYLLPHTVHSFFNKKS